LGVIAYELIELKRPFETEKKIKSEEPAPMTTSVTQEFLNLMMLLLQKDPA